MIEPTLSTSTPPPEEDVTTTLYRAAIGPVSNGYYLPIFTRFEAADRAGISWNTAASLLTLNWLVFRKLWVAALAYVGALVAVGLLVFGIGHLVFQFSDGLLMALGVGFGLAAFVLPGLFGNALFHAECRKVMAKALTAHANVADARDALLSEASDRKRMIKLAAVNVALLMLVGLAYQQFSALSNLSVMPHGALEAGTVGLSRTADTPTIPITMAPAAMGNTVASAPAPASAPAASAVAVSVAESASAPASAPAASPASTPASIPVQTPSTALPASQPEAAASTPIATQGKATRAAASSAANAKPITAKASTKAASAPSAKAPAKVPAKVPVQVSAKESAKESAKAPTKSFFINVGLFGVPENAAKAHAKLLEAGLPSVMKELKSKTRQIRVRVGPYETPAQVEAAAQKIKSLQLDASIVQL